MVNTAKGHGGSEFSGGFDWNIKLPTSGRSTARGWATRIFTVRMRSEAEGQTRDPNALVNTVPRASSRHSWRTRESRSLEPGRDRPDESIR